MIYFNKNNTYKFKNKTYYEVTLKPNTYFTNDKIEENNYYIVASIRSVNIYFDYYLKRKENFNYSYDITATLKSYADNGTKLIWTKDFNLQNINNIKDKEINIKENFNLDYEYYVNYVKTFQEYYNIKTETCLYVKLNIEINEKDNTYVLLTIPINENIIEITQKEDDSILKNNKEKINFNKILILDFIVIVIIIIISKNNKKDILKEYKDIIITTQNKSSTNNVIYLTNLKDLMNLAVNNSINIFNYKNSFYIIINNTYYIYNLNKDINV